MRGELRGQEDRRRTVCSTDDTDRTGFSRAKAHCVSTQESHEDTDLRSCSEKKRLRVRNQWSEICHSSHTDEDKTGIHTCFDADIEHIQQTTFFENRSVRVISRTVGIEKRRPQLAMIHSRSRQVGEQHTKSNRKQQERLVFLMNSKV